MWGVTAGRGYGLSVRVVKMTEPSVRVGSAMTAFNLPHNAKPPAGNPIVNSEGDLVEVFKKCFRENGATWIVGVLAMVNTLAISIHFWSASWCRTFIGTNVSLLFGIFAH